MDKYTAREVDRLGAALLIMAGTFLALFIAVLFGLFVWVGSARADDLLPPATPPTADDWWRLYVWGSLWLAVIAFWALVKTRPILSRLAYGLYLAVSAMAALAFVGIIPLRATAHTTVSGMTFDPWCCSGNAVTGDCQMIPRSSVKFSNGVYQVTLGPGDHPMVTRPHFYQMPQTEVRYSDDGNYYACLHPTEAELRCLYVVPEGS